MTDTQPPRDISDVFGLVVDMLAPTVFASAVATELLLEEAIQRSQADGNTDLLQRLTAVQERLKNANQEVTRRIEERRSQ